MITMEDQNEIDDVIWKAFTRATWLHKYFPFNFKTDFDLYKKGYLTPEEQPFYSDEIGIE